MKKLTIILAVILTVSLCGCEHSSNTKNITSQIEKTNNSLLLTYNKTNTTAPKNHLNNSNISKITYDFSKKVELNSMFLNLSYDNEITLDNKIIKKYKNITFVVSSTPLDMSSAYLYNDVEKFPERDKFGIYTYYKFTPKNSNLSVSYCYYRKIGNYYILIQTNHLNSNVNHLWEDWTKHILSLFEECNNTQ
ncbi:hypothetical protein [Methanocaldococcus sp.]